jgi:serine/threonine protein kinase
MNDLNNKHLIKSIATFTQGSNKYFLFPWANGGNLQQMIETEERELNEDLIRWTLVQILGLCEGIAALHKKNIRHGDIKPSNILRTGPDSGDFNESVLMIADVGLAKQHEEYTRVRTEITTSRYGTFNYEPPEVSPARELKTLSRNYDVWSLGCVFLELIIWTRYGVVGTKCFHKELKENHNSRFWITTSSKGVEKVFPAVESWITALKRDLKVIPPLCDLVQLIEERFLVISDKNRAGYKEIQEELERIRAEITKPDYLFTSGLESIEASRSITTSTALVKQPPINPLTEVSQISYRILGV